jgi:hypothetical protein
MKKLTAILAAMAVLLVSGISYAGDSVKTARDMWAMNMQRDAIVYLERFIQEHPADIEAHYQLGVYYFKYGRENYAKERFTPEPVRKKYGEDIAKLYMDAGDDKLGQGKLDEAVGYYHEAGKYSSGAMKRAADKLFAKGKATDDRRYFDASVKLGGNEYGFKVAKYYAEKAKQPGKDEVHQAKLLSVASRYNGNYKAEAKAKAKTVAAYLVQKGKDLAKIPGKEDEVNGIRNQLRELGFAELVEKELPEKVAYGPGTYTFSLNAGEQTPYWITFPSNAITNWNLDSPDGKFQAVYSDGEVVDCWSATKLPRNKYTFKLRAVTEQPAITMAVKQR